MVSWMIDSYGNEEQRNHWLPRLAIGLLSHGHLGGGFESLPASVAGAGFADVRSGATRFDFLGFVAANRPA